MGTDTDQTAAERAAELKHQRDMNLVLGVATNLMLALGLSWEHEVARLCNFAGPHEETKARWEAAAHKAHAQHAALLAEVRELRKLRDALLLDLFTESVKRSGNFWQCLRCPHIVHSYKQVHSCPKCGNPGGAGWWTSTNFAAWFKQEPEAFHRFRRDRLADQAAARAAQETQDAH